MSAVVCDMTYLSEGRLWCCCWFGKSIASEVAAGEIPTPTGAADGRRAPPAGKAAGEPLGDDESWPF